MGKTRYRNQRGGSVWTRFPTLSFQLTLGLGYKRKDQKIFSWAHYDKFPENLRKDHFLEMFEGDNEDEPLCTLRFTPHYGGRAIAYIDYLKCEKKTPRFKRASFLIVYKFLEILKSLGIEHVFFTVDARDDQWKLYSLYHDMGFVCVKEDESTMNDIGYEFMNLSNFKKEYEERAEVNRDYFSRILENVKSMNEEKKSDLGFQMHLDCYFMFGSVEGAMEKIEKYVAAQQGGKKTRKNKERK